MKSVKKIFFFVFIFFIFIACKNVYAVEINVDTHELYYLDDEYKEFFSIPSNYKTQAKITVTGASSVYYRAGEYVYYKVSTDGVVTFTGTMDLSDTITVIADGVEYPIEFHSKDYAPIYGDKWLDDFISKNVTSSMTTDYQKMQPIFNWLKNTDYSTEYYTTVDMAIHQAGDCWASSRMIVDYAHKLGLKAFVRVYSGEADGGVASTNHENAYVEMDGEGYVVEAGYYQSKPRPVNLGKTDKGFYTGYLGSPIGTTYTSYNGSAKELTFKDNITYTSWLFLYGLNDYAQTEIVHVSKDSIIQDNTFSCLQPLKTIDIDSGHDTYTSYDGSMFSKDRKTLHTYPSGKDSKKVYTYNFVETLADYSISYNEHMEEAYVQSPVKVIKQFAFYQDNALKFVDIADTVTKIEDNAFYRNPKLEYLIIRGKNVELGKITNAKNLVIIAPKGSTAEEYANSKNFTFYPLEDISDTSSIKVIHESDITVSNAIYKYPSVVPNVKVVVDGKTLVKDRDFVLEDFVDNDKVTLYAYVTIRGIGNYVGKQKVQFKISAGELEWEFLNPEVTYTGEPISPQVIVKSGGFEGKVMYEKREDSEYSDKIEYTEAGTYTFSLKISDDNYTYEPVYRTLTFKIVKQSIADAKTVEIGNFVYRKDAPYKDQIYNQKLTLNGKVLTKDVDYTESMNYVGYDENRNYIYQVAYTGIGLYTGWAYSNRFTIYDRYTLVTNYQDGDFIKPGENYPLTITSSIGYPLEQKYFTYSSSNENIVTVDANGVLHGVSAGRASIAIRSNDTYGVTKTLYVCVSEERVPLEAIITRTGSLPVAVGKKISALVSFLPSNTTDSRAVTYESSDPSIFTVNSSGTITTIKEGTATLTVRAANNVVDTVTIIVGEDSATTKLNSISIYPSKSTLSVGDTFQFGASYTPSTTDSDKTITWISTNPSVMTINSNGLATAKSAGKTYLILKSITGLARSMEVTVTSPITGIKLNKQNAFLGVNSTEKLVANIVPSNASGDTTLTWSSSNSSVVSVDQDGNIKGLKIGTATITVTSKNGKKATCTVTVQKVKRGDFSKDGDVTFSDVIIGLRKVFGYVSKTSEDVSIGDLNNNGDIDFTDIIILLRYVFGYITEI